MSLSFGFYNSSGGDRRYDARQISQLFNALIKDGVFMHIGSHFAVTEGSGMSVNVGTGYAWFNSTWTLNDAPLPITAEQSDLLLTRIDALVLEVNETVNSRTNSIKFVKGTPSANPQKPSLTNTNDVHQYALAYITIAPGTEAITQANIENNVGKEGCAFVTGILETVDISSLIAQWEAQWNEWLTQQKKETDEFQKTSEEEFTAWSNERKQEITNFQQSSEASFIAWFENIKDKLGEDPAGGLQNQVDELKASVTGYPLKLSANTNSLQITAKRNSIESIGVTGFTKQAGSGDASPENVRAISVATKRMVEIIVDGSEGWNDLSGITNTQYLSLPQYVYTDVAGGYRVPSYCSWLKRIEDSAPSDNPSAGMFSSYVRSSDKVLVLKVNAGFSTAEELKQFLTKNPAKFWVVPAAISQAAGIYLPIERTDEEGYHCDCIELSADLCEGDTVETFVKSGCDKEITFDGSSDENWSMRADIPGVFTYYNRVFSDYDNSGQSGSTVGPYLSNFLRAWKPGKVYNGSADMSFYIGESDKRVCICIKSVESVDALKQYLSQNNLVVKYRSISYTEQSDLPICLETHARRVIVVDGTNSGLEMDTLNDNNILLPLPDAKPLVECVCDRYKWTASYEDGVIYIDNAFTPRLGIMDYRFVSLEIAKSILAAEPATVVYELSEEVIYARDPVFIDNSDGSTVISAPEGCTMELSLIKNEAKLYKATLSKDSWTSSNSEFTQEATVKCIDGPGVLTEDSKWDSPIYVEQTSVLATNEKLIDVLTTLNAGEILFKDGAISCRVLEKPTSDIEIMFKAKR